MFKKLLNKTEVNHFVKSLEPLFEFQKYTEEIKPSNYANRLDTVYTATTKDNSWCLEISFNKRVDTGLERVHQYPEIKFKQNIVSMQSIIEYKGIEIADHFQKMYTPDFNAVNNIINLFIEKGLYSGLIHNVEKKDYNQHVGDYLRPDNNATHVMFRDKNVSVVTFNNILQRTNNKHPNHFKTSYINVGITHMIQPDQTISPYFKIKLPYSDNNKIVLIVPISNPKIVYITANEKSLKNNFLRKFNTFNIDNKSIGSYFEELFKNESKNLICKALNMKIKDIDALSTNELKKYFMLVEMVKI